MPREPGTNHGPESGLTCCFLLEKSERGENSFCGVPLRVLDGEMQGCRQDQHCDSQKETQKCGEGLTCTVRTIRSNEKNDYERHRKESERGNNFWSYASRLKRCSGKAIGSVDQDQPGRHHHGPRQLEGGPHDKD